MFISQFSRQVNIKKINIRFPMQSSKTQIVHEQEGNGFYIAQFKTSELAIFSYYIESAKQAVLIDPTLDVQAYINLAKKRGSKLISVLLTHYHADFLSGHCQFDLPIIMGESAVRAINSFKVSEYKNGYKFSIGTVSMKLLHTPGHTPESSCFRLFDENGKQFAIFSGDTVFLGEVGRPDLAASANVTKQDLAKMLFHSLQRVRNEVDPQARIYPGHGSGSSCGKSIGDGNYCTLGKQLEKNYAFQIKTEEQFAVQILKEMPSPPAYFFHDAAINQKGASRFDNLLKKSMVPISVEQFQDHIKNGAILIESRHVIDGGVIKGAHMLSENGTLAAWVGSLFPTDAKLILFVSQDKRQDLIERLLRIGYFNILGFNDFSMADWKAKGFQWYDVKIESASALKGNQDFTILDVRKPNEWKTTGVAENAKLISLGEIETKWEEMKDVKNIFVCCRTGLRARLASSILASHGVTSTIIADKFDQLCNNDVKIVPYQ